MDRSGKRLVPALSRISFLALLILFTATLGSCSDSDSRSKVVLYVSADDSVARKVIAAFERETGIHVLFVGDTEAKKTAGLANRLRAERDHPVADVFWSSECFLTIALADDGVFESHKPIRARPFAPDDAQGRWFAFAARPRVIAYSSQRVAPEDVPYTWHDLANEKFRGRLVMADPRFGTTGGHLGAMRTYFADHPEIGPYSYDQFTEGLAANAVRVLPGGNAAVVEAIEIGEADIGLTDSDDVWAARRRGAPIDMIMPRHHPERSVSGGGTILIPNTVARVRGGPNPAAAAKLIDFLLSPAVERMLAESDSRNVPLDPEVRAEFPALAVPDPLVVNWTAAASMRQTAIDEFLQAIDHRRSADAR